MNEEQVDSTVKVLTAAYMTAHDPEGLHPPLPWSEDFDRAGAYFVLVWEGLEMLRDLARFERGEELFAVIERLEPDVLSWTLAQAARELGEAGWEPPGPGATKETAPTAA
jgi:hypothetical protein